MAAKKNIYLIFSCDDWHSTSSMKLLMATTSDKKLKSYVAKKIEDGDFQYHSDICDTSKKQAAQFRKDFDVLTRREIHNHLAYGCFELTHDGEEL